MPNEQGELPRRMFHDYVRALRSDPRPVAAYVAGLFDEIGGSRFTMRTYMPEDRMRQGFRIEAMRIVALWQGRIDAFHFAFEGSRKKRSTDLDFLRSKLRELDRFTSGTRELGSNYAPQSLRAVQESGGHALAGFQTVVAGSDRFYNIFYPEAFVRVAYENCLAAGANEFACAMAIYFLLSVPLESTGGTFILPNS
jgi:hypothetical protein